MRTVAMITLVGFVLPGCIFAADSDKDGINNGKEEDLGLDPNNADSDDDGWNDGDEVDAGSDPLEPDTDGDGLLDGEENEIGTAFDEPDTDGDGYTDRDENYEDTDPLDEDDVIYEGGWPYYFGKTDLSGGNVFDENKRFGDFAFRDQFGDLVDIWDFYNDEGKYIIVDISATWCPPCNDLAGWLEHENDYFPEYEAIREAVQKGDIYWITIMGEDVQSGVPASASTAADWYDTYPHKKVPVLADQGYESIEFVELPFWPTLTLLKPDLKVDTMSSSSTWSPPMDAAQALLE
jgi:thiol-disulfide isomerase/thioredoxin